MKHSLPQPISSNIVYDSVQIENVSYFPDRQLYTARVYGVCDGAVMPLIIKTPVAVRRVEDVEITDAEIDYVLSQRPEVTLRTDAAMIRAFERLYALAGEQPNA